VIPLQILNSYRTKRLGYCVAVMLTILLGLASRKFGDYLPLVVADNAGDALWAMMVYFGFRFLLVQKGLVYSILFSLLFSFGIEFSQLYQAEWIHDIRSTTFGALVLGQGFLLVDLVRYTVGVLIAACLDKGIQVFIRNPRFKR